MNFCTSTPSGAEPVTITLTLPPRSDATFFLKMSGARQPDAPTPPASKLEMPEAMPPSTIHLTMPFIAPNLAVTPLYTLSSTAGAATRMSGLSACASPSWLGWSILTEVGVGADAAVADAVAAREDGDLDRELHDVRQRRYARYLYPGFM